MEREERGERGEMERGERREGERREDRAREETGERREERGERREERGERREERGERREERGERREERGERREERGERREERGERGEKREEEKEEKGMTLDLSLLSAFARGVFLSLHVRDDMCLHSGSWLLSGFLLCNLARQAANCSKRNPKTCTLQRII